MIGLLGGGNLNITLQEIIQKLKLLNLISQKVLLESFTRRIFQPDQINIIESLSPKTKASLGLNYKINKFNFLVRNTYFGEVIRDGFPYGSVQNLNLQSGYRP